MLVELRDAIPADAATLTAIAHAAKAHWGYSPEQLAAWAGELTLESARIGSGSTRVARIGGQPVGFSQLTGNGADRVLEHLWVSPRMIGRGVGGRLLDDACERARTNGARRLLIDADPNACAFYVARGATPVANVPAPITGQPHRVRPQLVLPLIPRR